MASENVKRYITDRYYRWLDASKYRCSQAGIPEDADDVMNEVILSLLKMDDEKIERMRNSPAYVKKQLVTELDRYVLQMIHLNASSPTSPYQSKYKAIPVDVNVDYSRLEIEDCCEESFDHASYILRRRNDLREITEEMGFSSEAMEILEFRFFQNGEFKEWDGDASTKRLYDIYSRVMGLVRKKMNGELLL